MAQLTKDFILNHHCFLFSEENLDAHFYVSDEHKDPYLEQDLKELFPSKKIFFHPLINNYLLIS